MWSIATFCIVAFYLAPTVLVAKLECQKMEFQYNISHAWLKEINLLSLGLNNSYQLWGDEVGVKH